MSKYDVEYCPWCGGSVSRTIETHGGTGFQAKECDDCDSVFRVEVPHKNTEIKWTTAQ